MDKPPFIVTHPRTGADMVCAARLAQHVRQTLRYFFMQDHVMSAARCYVYQDGAYRLMSRTMMLGVIKQYITDYDEYLVKSSILNEVYELLLTDNIFVSEDALNADENLINFQNGLLRLSDMTLLPHTPDIFSTIQLPCNWPGASRSTPVYDAYMDTLTGGDKATGGCFNVTPTLINLLAACVELDTVDDFLQVLVAHDAVYVPALSGIEITPQHVRISSFGEAPDVRTLKAYGQLAVLMAIRSRELRYVYARHIPVTNELFTSGRGSSRLA